MLTFPPTPPPSPRLRPSCTQTLVRRQLPVQTSANSCQSEETLPFSHCDLIGNEEWDHCVISTTDLAQFPCFVQRQSVHVVRNRPGDGDVDVAVNIAHIQGLHNHGKLHPVSTERCLYEPSEGEKRVSGSDEARKKARCCFIKRAVEGILTHGLGLGRFYQQRVDDARLLGVIEWAILEHDIAVSLRGSVFCFGTDFI